MNHRPQNDRDFEAFLAGEDSDLARLYRRLPQSEPDAKLDAAVLAMARAAVEPQRRNALRHAKDRHRRPLWVVGLSSAAGIVLAAGLAWQMRGAFNDSLPSASQSAAPPSARADREVIPISAIVPPPEPAPADAGATLPEPSTPSPAAAPAAPPPPPAPMAEAAKPAPRLAKTAPHRREVDVASAASVDKKDQTQRFETEPPREPEAAAPAREALAGAAAGTSADRADAEGDASKAASATGYDAPSRAQPFPGGPAADYNSVERKAAIASGTRRDDYGLDVDAGSADPLVKQEERARVARQSSKEKGTGGHGLSSKPAAPIVAETAAAPPPAVAAQTTPVPASAAAAPKPTAAAAAPTAATAGQPVGTELQRNAQLAPDDWIVRIRELLRAERKTDAIENLELLHRRHPDYVLPEDLRKLLP
jgi:hypothetical protein